MPRYIPFRIWIHSSDFRTYLGILRFFLIIAASLSYCQSNAQFGMPIVNSATFRQSNRSIQYNDLKSGIALSAFRIANDDSLLIVLKNTSSNDIGYIDGIYPGRFGGLWSIGGLPESHLHFDKSKKLKMKFLSIGKSDSFYLDISKNDEYRIYLSTYVIDRQLLQRISMYDPAIIQTYKRKHQSLFSYSLVDSLEGTMDVYQLLTLKSFSKAIESNKPIVVETRKYSECKYDINSYPSINTMPNEVRPNKKLMQLDSTSYSKSSQTLKYQNKQNHYSISLRKTLSDTPRILLTFQNTSNSPMGFIPSLDSGNSKNGYWTLGSFFIDPGGDGLSFVLEMRCLAPGEEVTYVIDISKSAIYNIQLKMCINLNDKILASGKSQKPHFKNMNGRRYVEVSYSNSIMEIPGLFNFISFESISRSDSFPKGVTAKVSGYK
jgi:hypothetical protein